MAEEIIKVPIPTLPEATSVTDSDHFIVVQGGRAKRAKPSLMKGNTGTTPVITPKVNMIAYGGAPTVSKTGTAEAPVLTFNLPAGKNGETPILMKTSAGIGYKYVGEPDSVFRLLITIDELKLKFTDLTAAQKNELKLKFSDLTPADIIVLQQPAASVVSDLRLLEDEVETKESARIAAETARVTKETARQTSETARGTAETSRSTAESTRVTKETARQTSETARVTAETARASAESTRVTKETARQTSETARQTNSETAITNVNTAKDAANTAALAAKEVADHPNYTGTDYFVYKWNPVTKVYDKTNIYLKGEGLNYSTMSPEEIAGITGKSAYDVALENGFVGTEDEWLESLKGADGDPVNLENEGIVFTEAATKVTINTGDTIPTVFGKLKKWFSSFGTFAWKSSLSWTELTGRPTIPTNVSQLTNDSTYQTGTQVNSSIVTHNSDTGAHNDIRTKLTEVEAIAKGKARAKVFTTVAVLDAWLTVAANKATLQIGDNFYIEDTSVPDYWWNGTAKKPIEGEKVDLSDYYNKAAADGRYVQKESGKGLSANDYTAAEKTKLAALSEPVIKSYTLSVASWVSASGKWTQYIYDSAILLKSLVSVVPDSDTLTVFQAAEFQPQATVSVGNILITAKNKPTAVINIKYSIQ